MSTEFLLSVGGWYILPDLLTNRLLAFQPYRNALSRFSHPRNHYRYTFATVVLSYLLYTLFTSISSTEPNFYQVLGVTPSVDETGLRSAFRRASLVYHPDRMKDAKDEGEMFMYLRNMYESLKDPAKRYAYDRFGPDVLECSSCSSHREYLSHGGLQSLGFHAVGFVALVFFSLVGTRSPVSFWRFVLFALGGIWELSVILAPFPLSQYPMETLSIQDAATAFSSSASWTTWQARLTQPPMTALPLAVLTFLFPSRVPYQHVKFIHQLSVFLSMALTRVAPVLIPPPMADEAMAVERGKLLLSLVQAIETETRGIINHTLRMIQKPGSTENSLDMETLSLLQTSMEDVLVEDALARDVPEAWHEARGRAEKHVLASTLSNRHNGVTRQTLKWRPGGLPSPTPSPPPGGSTKSGYARARSLSC